jgi:hypothetical protein
MKSGCIAGNSVISGRGQNTRRASCAAGACVGFCAGEAFAEEGDLAGVVRFVLANVEPLAQIVCGSPEPALVGS